MLKIVSSRLDNPLIALAFLTIHGIDYKKALGQLSYRKREIVKLRCGLGDGLRYTLEEMGHIFKATRERIRSIEKKAQRKLRLRVEDLIAKSHVKMS